MGTCCGWCCSPLSKRKTDEITKQFISMTKPRTIHIAPQHNPRKRESGTGPRKDGRKQHHPHGERRKHHHAKRREKQHHPKKGCVLLSFGLVLPFPFLLCGEFTSWEVPLSFWVVLLSLPSSLVWWWFHPLTPCWANDARVCPVFWVLKAPRCHNMLSDGEDSMSASTVCKRERNLSIDLDADSHSS